MVSNTNFINDSDLFKESKEYWYSRLSQGLKETIIPGNFFETGEHERDYFETELSIELTQRLINISKDNDLALYVVLLSGIKVLLNKFTGEEDIVAVSPAYKNGDLSNKLKASPFIIFRDFVQQEFSFRELLKNIKSTVLEGYKNQFFPLDKLFFDFGLDYEDYVSDCVVLSLDTIHGRDIFLEGERIAISISKCSPCLQVRVTYNSKIYTKETIDTLVKHYIKILNGAALNLEEKILNLDRVTEEEKQQLKLIHFDRTQRKSHSTLKIKSREAFQEKASSKHIEKAVEKDYYDASMVQNRMYMLQQMDLQSIGYNMPVAVEIKGALDVKRLEQAVKELIRRHESFRTSFKIVEGKVVQVIHKEVDFRADYIEKPDMDIEELIKEFMKPFDLSCAPLLRMCVVKLEENRYMMVFDMHHIISDGLSVTIMADETFRSYGGENLKELRLQYRDFSEWQNKLIESGAMKKQEEYWTNKFSDDIPILNLPTDFERPAIKGFDGDVLSVKLDSKLIKELRKLARGTGNTMYMVMLSALNILLSKYSGQEDIIIGTPTTGRTHADLEKVIGMFVNTLVMRNYPAKDKTYEEFLREVKENTLQAFENQDYEFRELLDKLNLKRDLSRNQLFDVMFAMQNHDLQGNEFYGLTFNSYPVKHKVAKVDLTFTIKEYSNNILIAAQYDTKLFKGDTIERMMVHFLNILNQIAVNPKVKLGSIDMLSKEERNKLLFEFNDTHLDYPKEKAVHKLIEEQAVKTPERVALIFNEEKLTYRELDIKSNKLAKNLRKKGVKQDSIVALIVEPSLKMVIGMLGILKAGGAYLPISHEFPEDRIKYILEDSKASAVLTQNKYFDLISFKGEVMDLWDEGTYVGEGEALPYINSLSDLAYVIYTSGTTGRPKGVMIEHKNLLAYIHAFQKEYRLNENDNVLQQANYSFDAFIEEVYPALTVGGKVFIVSKYDALNISNIQEFIYKNKINLISCSPLFLNELNKCQKLESVHTFISGGDVLKKEYFNNLIRHSKIYNTCGPTETTVCFSYYNCPKDIEGNIPIGKPIANYQIFILDSSRNPVPVGVAGEICISGHGVARGYLNSPELTAQQFVDNPFKEGEKMYKTGDLGRWLPDGNIEFLGRVDHQIKIRGFRIEIGEIEGYLLKYEGIREAVVLAREDNNGGKYLCAYIAADKELTVAELRESLAKDLPEYMIPSYFIQLEKIPQTSNGKIDREALGKLEANVVTGTEYEAPRNETEEKVAAIWREVLGVERVGINDNFFELGGHSLKATILVGKLHKEFNIKISLKEVFISPTIKGISNYIENTEITIYNSIKPVEEKEFYEASSAQKRMYMLQQFDPQGTGYNMPMAIEVNGSFNKDDIENVFKTLIERHEALRTSFETVDEKVVQKISRHVDFKLQFIESAGKAPSDAVMGFIRPFDLSRAPLLRAGLIRLEEDRHIFMFDMHHIIADGVSLEIFINEFIKLCAGMKLEELKIQYKDYSEWQNKMLKSEEMHKQEEYWINRFSDEVPILNMPTDYARPMLQSLEGDSINFKLDKGITKELREIARETGSTMYMIILSGINILLSKYCGQEDVIVGSTIAGRPHTDLEKIIGMFVNTIALRNYPAGNKTYKEFLLEVKENALKAYDNQDYQFEELVEKINLRRDISRNPLFDVMFTMINSTQSKLETIDENQIKGTELSFKAYKQEHKVSKFDLTFAAKEMKEEILFTLEYCTKLFKRETVEKIKDHLEEIFKTVVSDTNIKISEIDMLTEKEKHKIIYEFNDTFAEYPRESTIHELFELQAEKIPDKAAVVFGDETLTYSELNEKSNRLARTLRSKGVGVDSIVGIMAERSLEMMVGLMGILKAGGAYLPIDPDYPEDRVRYVLEDSKAKLLLIQKHLLNKISFEGEILDLLDASIYSDDFDNLKNFNSSKDLAYIIYTSGTTGRPKGVAVEHRSAINTLEFLQKRYPFTANDVYLFKTNYTFDVSVAEIFGWFSGNGTLAMISNEESKDINAIINAIEKYKVTHINFVPSMLNMFIKANDSNAKISSLKYVFAAGEELRANLAKDFYEKFSSIRLENLYGPTEATIYSSGYSVDKAFNGEVIPIGRPAANSRAYILDKYNRILPVGVRGELYIAGEGLARGYVNNHELTAEKFIENPFVKDERMYRTGDAARWLTDGNIEFSGRVDHQVKIRGFRIELGEIEINILNFNGVKEVVVMDREDESGSKYLCAYIVSEGEIPVGDIRRYLLKKLPEYMMPSYFMFLQKMPLNSNGKIDRKALPNPEVNMKTGTEYEAPRNKIEEELCRVWQEVLRVEKIGINDNFFELGGHSLKAAVLTSRIHKALDVEIPLKTFFSLPTIKGLSEYIQKAEKNLYASIEKAPEREYYEASPAQKRMYVLQQFDLSSTVYNMPSVIEVDGEFNKERIEYAVRALIERHEALRTSFETIDGEIVQRINEKVNFEIEYIEAQEETQAEAAAAVCLGVNREKRADEAVRSFVRAFDLCKAPMFRVGIMKVQPEKHILMFDMHHIISDGVSMVILINEFMKLYEGKELKKLKLQYKDYSYWLNNLLKSDEMRKQEEYWRNKLSGEIPVLNMSTDHQRPSIKSYEGDIVSFSVESELAKKINKLCKETECTLYMLLLSAVNILLSKYSGQEDIIIGSPIAGRSHADLEGIIGIFLNTIAMRNEPGEEKVYEEFLKEVRENALRAYENQDYPFEELVNKLNLPRDLSRNPLFDVMFVLQNLESDEVNLEKAVFKQYKSENKTSKLDITIAAVEAGEEIRFSIQYNTKLFEKRTMERMAVHLKNVLNAIAENRRVKIKDIELLEEGEKHLLLCGFNDTCADYERDKTIHQVFEEQVEKTPNNTAVVFEDRRLTYRELNERVNRLARTLREKGVKPDDIVAIMVERSLEMIVGIMAIIKAGGAYLPIDPEYPEDRIKFIFEDSNAKILLIQNKFLEIATIDGQVISLEDDGAYSDDGDNLEIVNSSKDLAYVIYTSGSTGAPKGVMIEHHSVINRINWMQKSYPISDADVILQKTTYTFDVSVWELFWWSFTGASVCLLPYKGERDPEAILNCIEKNNVTTMHFVPSMLSGFMLYIYAKDEKNRLAGLRQVFCSGEALSVKQVEMFKNLTKNIRLINLYGPTEATVDVSHYECLSEESLNSIPIGKPIDNINLYIIGKNNSLQPIGVGGELCISGVGLARGYLNKIELTKEKFVENPFLNGERMYKTGDLAKWLPDGNIEYLGRLDHQVKIRGFRIELGEIEAVLRKHPAVKDVVVIARKIKADLSGNRLIAYLVYEGEEKPSDESIRSFLRNKLPEYMVPSYFIASDNIPLTSNGKVNMKALPEPDSERAKTEENYAPPSTETEKILVEIWTKVLKLNDIGIHNNFFNLGGDSILSIQVVSGAKEKGINLSVQQVFQYPTIYELAAQLDSNKPEAVSRIQTQAFSLLSEKDRAKLLKLNNLQKTIDKRSE